jgi:hypothetical protein
MPKQVDLLGYLLGALDASEQETIRKELETDRELEGQLHDWEERLAPWERVCAEYEPPPGLATTTCEFVFAQVRTKRPWFQEARGASADSSRHSWSLVDAVVAAGIFLAASMLFFPAISNSRHQARLAACHNNLRTFGVALPSWADRFSGAIPYIPTTGKTGVAGFYAPQLMDAGYVTQHQVFLCPSSSLARQRNTFRVPSVDGIQRAAGTQLLAMQQRMGGSYNYVLGHFERGHHRATRIRGRPYFPVLADRVAMNRPQFGADAHGGRGVSVLFEDGHVRFIVFQNRRQQPNDASPDNWESMFVSDRGYVEAGMHADDAVLGPSWARPRPDLFSDSDLIP